MHIENSKANKANCQENCNNHSATLHDFTKGFDLVPRKLCMYLINNDLKKNK